ncbi:MAG TPA: dicarboxylate/amino acid:cation symporter [Verrucomicrobiae bacterium]|nr:dicarboxylate/amino acid:cation symporter [Verrucomicrobiae bacterium]
MDTGPSRHGRVLWGLLIGAVAGVAANLILGQTNPRLSWFVLNVSDPIGQLFLRLLLLTVIPLVFSSLIIGLAGLGNIRSLGRIGIRSLAYCLVISAISVAIGLLLANTIKPGKRIAPETAAALQKQFSAEAEKRVAEAPKKRDPVPLDLVKSFVPSNPIASLASDPPNMLHLIFFAVLFGAAILMLPSEKSATLLGALEGLYAASAKVIDIIMRLAPIAIACLLFTNTARFGLDLLQALGWFVVTVLVGLALHMFGTYSLAVRAVGGMGALEFFRRIRTVLVTAFSTSSSAATLPTSLRVSEENLGIPREIGSFVLTVGATANQNGTALYEGVTVLFLAQLAGVDLSLGQQILVAYLAILGSIGTAGVPSGSIPFIIVVLSTISVNPALIGIILGVDRVLDMCRTTLNVAGDLTAALYVARAEAKVK